LELLVVVGADRNESVFGGAGAEPDGKYRCPGRPSAGQRRNGSDGQRTTAEPALNTTGLGQSAVNPRVRIGAFFFWLNMDGGGYDIMVPRERGGGWFDDMRADGRAPAQMRPVR